MTVSTLLGILYNRVSHFRVHYASLLIFYKHVCATFSHPSYSNEAVITVIYLNLYPPTTTGTATILSIWRLGESIFSDNAKNRTFLLSLVEKYGSALIADILEKNIYKKKLCILKNERIFEHVYIRITIFIIWKENSWIRFARITTVPWKNNSLGDFNMKPTTNINIFVTPEGF